MSTLLRNSILDVRPYPESEDKFSHRAPYWVCVYPLGVKIHLLLLKPKSFAFSLRLENTNLCTHLAGYNQPIVTWKRMSFVQYFAAEERRLCTAGLPVDLL